MALDGRERGREDQNFPQYNFRSSGSIGSTKSPWKHTMTNDKPRDISPPPLKRPRMSLDTSNTQPVLLHKSVARLSGSTTVTTGSSKDVRPSLPTTPNTVPPTKEQRKQEKELTRTTTKSRVPDDDEVSISSVFSISDASVVSLSKTLLCTECKGSAASYNPLVACSMCRRRYHESCQLPKPPVGNQSPWHCSRCIKKMRKKKLKNFQSVNENEKPINRETIATDKERVEAPGIETSKLEPDLPRRFPNPVSRRSSTSQQPQTVAASTPSQPSVPLPRHSGQKFRLSTSRDLKEADIDLSIQDEDVHAILNSTTVKKSPRVPNSSNSSSSRSYREIPSTPSQSELSIPRQKPSLNRLSSNMRRESAHVEDESLVSSQPLPQLDSPAYTFCSKCRKIKILAQNSSGNLTCLSCKEKQNKSSAHQVPRSTIPETPQSTAFNATSPSASQRSGPKNQSIKSLNRNSYRSPGRITFKKATGMVPPVKQPIFSRKEDQHIDPAPRLEERGAEKLRVDGRNEDGTSQESNDVAMSRKERDERPARNTTDTSSIHGPQRIESEMLPPNDTQAPLPNDNTCVPPKAVSGCSKTTDVSQVDTSGRPPNFPVGQHFWAHTKSVSFGNPTRLNAQVPRMSPASSLDPRAFLGSKWLSSPGMPQTSGFQRITELSKPLQLETDERTSKPEKLPAGPAQKIGALQKNPSPDTNKQTLNSGKLPASPSQETNAIHRPSSPDTNESTTKPKNRPSSARQVTKEVRGPSHHHIVDLSLSSSSSPTDTETDHEERGEELVSPKLVKIERPPASVTGSGKKSLIVKAKIGSFASTLKERDQTSFVAASFSSSATSVLTYRQLIGIVLIHAQGSPLTVGEIKDWIADTFPEYRRGEGKWEQSISPVLSQTADFVKQRRPGQAIWCWALASHASKKRYEHLMPVIPAKAVVSSPASAAPKQNSSIADIGKESRSTTISHDYSSAESISDTETSLTESSELPEFMDVDDPKAPAQPVDRRASDGESNVRDRVNEVSVSTIVSEDTNFDLPWKITPRNMPMEDETVHDNFWEAFPDYTAGFTEEQRAKKMAEIKRRPSRKETFGKVLAYSRSSRPRLNPHQEVMRPDSDHNLAHWRKHLDLPQHPIPILYEGQLAFREGVLVNGRLPRPRTIYKVGRNVAGELI